MAEEQRQILIDVELENRDFQAELDKNNKLILKSQERIAKLTKKYKEGEITIDQYVRRKGKLQQKNKELSAQNRDIIKDQKTEANSLNALRRQLAKLTAERNNLDTSLEGNAQKFQELQDEILQTTTKIKGFEQAGGDFRRNVGNYTSSVQEALAASGSFGQGIVGLGGQVQGLFTLIKANPIGILITAVSALIGLFTRSSKATNFFAESSARLNATMNVLIDRAEKLFDTFTFLFNGDFTNAFNSAKEAVSGIGDEIQRETQDAALLNAALRRTEQELALIGIRRRESIRDQERLKNIRDNELLSIDKRIKANEELFKIESQFNQEAISAAQKRVSILQNIIKQRGEEGQSIDEIIKKLGLQDETVQQLIEARTELADIEEESIGRENEFITNKTSLIREDADNQLALLEAQIQSELAVLEDGNQRKLDLELQLIEKRRQLLIEAAGEDATILAAINQEADNERLEKFRAFQENQVQLETIKSKKVEGITEEETQNRLKNIGKSIAATVDANKLEIEDDRKTKEIKAQLEAQLLNNTLSILGSIDESGKASALLQIGLSAAQGVAAAVKAGAGVAFPGNLLAIGAGVSSVLAAIGQARQIFSQSAGAGAGASGAGSAPRVNTGLVSSEGGGNIGLINAGLLSQFSEPLRSEQRTAQSTANAVSNLGPLFVAVTDINKGQRRLNAKVTEARLG